MNFWNKSKIQPDANSNPTQSRPDAIEQRLEQIHFQARSDFREDLKARLMQNLAEQPQLKVTAGRADLVPGLTHRRYLPSRTRLALGGIGLVALLVLLISILSVGAVYRNPTASASVAAGGAVGVTSTSPVASNPAAAIQKALKSFFDPVEAAKKVGFTVNLPGYLPAGYKLSYAAVNTPAAAPPTTGTALLNPTGYTLRFSDTALPAAQTSQIEIAQWQVPLKIEATGATTLAQGTFQTLPGEAGIQKSQAITVSGAPAVIIQGGQWQMQLSTTLPVSGTVTGPGEPGNNGPVALNPLPAPAPVTATTVISGPIPVSGASGAGAANVTVAGPVISFAQVGTVSTITVQGQTITSDSGIVIIFDARQAQVKTLVWQQDTLLTVLTTPANLSDNELKQIAESLKSGG